MSSRSVAQDVDFCELQSLHESFKLVKQSRQCEL